MKKSNTKINDMNSKENKSKLALSGDLALCLLPVIGLKISGIIFVGCNIIIITNILTLIYFTSNEKFVHFYSQ